MRRLLKWTTISAVLCAGVMLTPGTLKRFAQSPASKRIVPLYAFIFNIDLSLLVNPKDFSTLQSFFTRKIKDRPVDQDISVVVSPSDGELICSNVVTGPDAFVYAKDKTYSLEEFLGEKWENIRPGKDSQLHQLVFYLSPKDYHRFHSPYRFLRTGLAQLGGFSLMGHNVSLLPVSEHYISTIGPQPYLQNFRKILKGKTAFGKIYLGFVAAVNVGGVKVIQNEVYEKGAETGQFQMGSTVVMIIEMPTGTRPRELGKVDYGQGVLFMQN